MKEIGKIQFNKNDGRIGIGNRNTVVYKGKYDGELNVAIKRIDKEVATVEKEVLQKFDNHPNIVKHYAIEEDEDFL